MAISIPSDRRRSRRFVMRQLILPGGFTGRSPSHTFHGDQSASDGEHGGQTFLWLNAQ
jgi:hypothetical protein